jgi:hypothetical protein
MSISFVAASTVNTGNGTSASATVPATAQAGDLIFMAVTGSGPTAPSGWNIASPVSTGTFLYWKVAVAGDIGASVTSTTILAPWTAYISAYRATGTWAAPRFSGNNATPVGSTATVTGATQLDLLSGDLLAGFMTASTTQTYASEAFSVAGSGVTFGSTTERVDSSLQALATVPISAGSTARVPTLTITTSTTATVSVNFVRLRELASGLNVIPGDPVNGSGSLNVPYPSTVPASAGVFLVVSDKLGTTTPTTPSGWTSLYTVSAGSGADGADSGAIRVTVYRKDTDAAGTETSSTTQSVTITSGNSALGQIFVVPIASGKRLVTAGSDASDTTVDTSYSASAPSDLGLTVDDLLLTVTAINTDVATFSSESVSATGVSAWGTLANYTDVSTTTGNDQALVVCSRVVTTGTATAGPVFTMTASSSNTNGPTGPTIFLRIRAQDLISQIVGSASFALSQSGALNGTAVAAGSSAVTFGQSGALKGTGNAVGTAAITLSPTGAIVATGAGVGSASFAFAPSGSLVGAGALAGSSAVAFAPSAAIKGTASGAGTSAVTFSQSGALKGTGALTGTTSATLACSGAIKGTGACVGNTTCTFSGSGGLKGTANGSGSAAFAFAPAASIIGTAAIDGAASFAFTQAGSLAGDGALTGTTALTFLSAGDLQNLTTYAEMVGASSFALAASAVLAGLGDLTGSSLVNLGATAAIGADASAPGSAAIAVTASGALEGNGALIGSTSIATASLGMLLGTGELTGFISISFDLSGRLLSGIPEPALLQFIKPKPALSFLFANPHPTLALVFSAPRPALTLTLHIVRNRMAINVGDDLPIPLEIRSTATGGVTDPDTLTWYVKHEDGSALTFVHGTNSESAKTSTGRYVLTYRVTKAGRHQVVAIVTGSVYGREPTAFEAQGTVADDAFPP